MKNKRKYTMHSTIGVRKILYIHVYTTGTKIEKPINKIQKLTEIIDDFKR